MRLSMWPRLSARVCALLLVAGCATPQPLPFRLIDAASRVQSGTFFPDSQRIEVTLEGRRYTGFYLGATSVAYSQSLSSWRFFPHDTVTTIASNSARAHLVAEDGKQMSCEFLIEARRALGECRTPDGAVYQLVADGN